MFDPKIWKPTREGVAAGLSTGLFIGLTPTMGLQVVLALAAAYLLRVNVPAALAGILITNPLTAPVIYPLQYKLGLWLGANPNLPETAAGTGMFRTLWFYSKPLWVGSLISATVSSALAYGAVWLGWQWLGPDSRQGRRRVYDDTNGRTEP